MLNVPPVWQVYYPQPDRPDAKARAQLVDTVAVDDGHVQVVALKKAEEGNHLIVRLQETGGRGRPITIRVKPYRERIRTSIAKHSLLTLCIRRGARKLTWREVDLVERR